MAKTKKLPKIFFRNKKGQFRSKKQVQSAVRSQRYRKTLKPIKPIYKKGGFVVLNKKALPSGFIALPKPYPPPQIINRKLNARFEATPTSARRAYLPKIYRNYTPAQKQKLLISTLEKIQTFKEKRRFASRDVPVQVASLNRNITQSYPVLKRYQSPKSIQELRENIAQLDSDLAVVLGEAYGLDIAGATSETELEAKAYEFQQTLKQVVMEAPGTDIVNELIQMAQEAGLSREDPNFATFSNLYWDEAAVRIQMRNYRVQDISSLVKKRAKPDFYDRE